VGRTRLLAAIAVALVVCATGVAFAESPDPDSSLESHLPAESFDAEPVSLPDGEDIREGIEAAEAEQAARERWLASPEAVKQRQQSRYAFSGLFAADSKELFLNLFSEHLRRLNTDPARWLSDASIVEPLDESSATVRKEGDTTLLSGTTPLRAENEDGELRKVDLTLEAISEGLEPVNPLVELRIPEVAGEGIAMGEGERSIAVTPLGVEDRPVQLLGDKSAFYPDARGASADTDQILAPTSTGVEIFELLRSTESPEVFRYRIEMPEGAELVPDETGGARIVRDGEQIASIPFPYAIDAQGTPLEVGLEIEGETIALNVDHRQADIAYPLLLDPAIVNDYYNYNWFNGHNLDFLENETWNYSENWGWIEGFTSCQYSCFGPSGRALYISMIAGAHGANEWGQWLFKSPNANSFLSAAWANPFVRDDRANCPRSQYPQPHDYLGMWHNGAWNGAVKIDQAAIYGYTEANSWGSALVIGMGTGNGSATPCRRDLAVGGAAIWEDDWQQPSIDGVSGIPGGWVGDESVPITVQARDEGLGVDYVSLHPQGGGGTQVKNHSCNGYAGSRCPINWPVLFDLHADHFGEGIREVSISATDPTFKTSLTYKAQTKVDRNPPQVTLDGQLAEATDADEGEQQAAEEVEKLRLPVYNLTIDAVDGNPNGALEDKRSGVKDIRVFLDGAEQEVSWSAQGCSGPNFSCPMEKAYPLELSKLTSAGEHKLKVIVEDQVGNERERNIEFEYFPATGMKDEYVMHYFPLPDGQGNEAEEEHPRRPELAVNVMNGNLVYREQDIDVEGTAAVDLELERYYNSQLPTAENSEFGDGWTLAETPHLDPVDTGGSPEPDEAQLLDASGAIEEDVELPTEAGAERFDPALQARLTKKAEGGYELTDETGESATSVAFDETGQTEALLTESFAKVDYTYESGELAEIAVIDPATVGVADPSELQIPEPPPFPPPSFFYAFGVSGEEEGEFDEPTDAAVGPQGDIWVVDAENNRIQHFGSYGEYLGEFGSYGTGSGQFRYPTAIEIDPEGNLWVLDSYNNRVQKFNQQGEFLAKWGSYGTALGKLDTPSGLALDAEGDVWVSDTGNGRIQKFSPSGTPLEVAGISGEGELNDPAGLDVGPEGEVFVADWAESHVVVFDTSGDYVRQFGSYGYGEGQLRHPDTVEVDTRGGVWVADEFDGELEHFDAEGQFIAQYGSEGEGDGEFDFNRPAGIASDAEGGLWIADSGNDRVQFWTRDGYAPGYATAVGSSGTGNGQLDLPGDVDIDSEGDIWVVDTTNNRVQQLSPEGSFKSKFGTLGSADGQLKRPSAIEIDAADNIWIADAGNDRVQKFNQAGQYLAKFGGSGTAEGKLDSPEGLAIDQSGDIWVADTWNDRVQRFSASGEFLKALGTSGEGELDEPMGLDAVFGEVFVADYEHDRIAVFDEAGNYLHEFGSHGYGLGQFRYPSSLEIDEGGNVWVGDEGNERILQFNIAGEFVTHFGSEGEGEGEFELTSPTGIATDAEGGIWIADSGNDRLQRWEIPGFVPAPEPELTDADPAVEVDVEGGLVTDVTGNAAGSHSYEHTGDNLMAHDGPDGETEYEYDAAGRMTKVTLPNGTWGEIKYFSDGRVESVTVDPAGEEPAKTTNFEYSDKPRRTFVEVPGEPNVTYDIGADGSVLKWWNTAQPPEIDDLAGSLYAAREKSGIEPGTYNLEAYAYSPEGIASIQFISDGDILVDEVTCEGKAAECEELANEWVTETGQHAPGILNVEVITTDHDGNIESERFWVDIPVTPPEPHGALTPPKFKDVLRFRKDYGLEVVFPVANEFELNDRIFDLIGAWHNPHTPAGEVARASWERWGVPLRPADVAEMEYREWFNDVNGERIDEWVEESAPGNFAGYYI
jgi:tripartite motif-containing protein 71